MYIRCVVVFSLLILAGCSDAIEKPSEGFSIVWGDFVKNQDSFGNEGWVIDVEITNYNRDSSIFFESKVEGSGFTSGGEFVLGPGESTLTRPEIKIFWGIDKSQSMEFGKQNISFLVYECNKLPEDVQSELCLRNWLSEGVTAPLNLFLTRRAREGNPVHPTNIHSKYFDYNSLESPPTEISLEEFMLE